MENLFVFLVVFFPSTYNMDKNKFMQQHSAHNQGLCLKCIYKKRLAWRMFLLVVDIFFHILKAHLNRQTPSHDLTAVLIKGKNNDSSEFHSMTSSHAGEYLLISSRQSICRSWLWWCRDAENAPLWLSRCVAQQRTVIRTLAGTDLKAEAAWQSQHPARLQITHWKSSTEACKQKELRMQERQLYGESQCPGRSEGRWLTGDVRHCPCRRVNQILLSEKDSRAVLENCCRVCFACRPLLPQ